MPKDKKIVDEKPQDEVQEAPKMPNVRYFCDACTGVAFEMVEGDEYPKNPVCKSCGKPVGAIKPENFIKIK